VTGTVQAGSIFGEMGMLGQAMADSYAEALEDCTLCVMSRDDIVRLVGRFPSIAVRMLDRLASRLREAEKRLEDVAYRPVHARVANTLLRLEQQGEVAVGGALRHAIDDLADLEIARDGRADAAEAVALFQQRHELREVAERHQSE